jgi:hypothetical protein|tara:strand:- start:99 stop:428 length:330 start_codon:yes stop_codon:yes gene_type:complete
MRYLFYNLDSKKNLIDNLIATKPDNYELIKWGWAPDIETAREDKLTELGKPEIRGLPAVIYNRQAWKETYGNDDFVNKKQQWYAIPLCDESESNWNWTWINNQITDEVE